MVDFLKIANAIPQTELDACMAELNVFHPRLKKVFTLDKDGHVIKDLDENGVQKTVQAKEKDGSDSPPTNGKFMNPTSLEAAFNAIKNKKTLKSPSKSIVTYGSIAQLIDFDFAEQLQINVLLAIAGGDLNQWVDDSLSGGGIDVKDSKLKTKLLSFNEKYGFTIDFINQMKTMSDTEPFDFPRLKLGHVQNALQQRHEGII